MLFRGHLVLKVGRPEGLQPYGVSKTGFRHPVVVDLSGDQDSD